MEGGAPTQCRGGAGQECLCLSNLGWGAWLNPSSSLHPNCFTYQILGQLAGVVLEMQTPGLFEPSLESPGSQRRQGRGTRALHYSDFLSGRRDPGSVSFHGSNVLGDCQEATRPLLTGLPVDTVRVVAGTSNKGCLTQGFHSCSVMSQKECKLGSRQTWVQILIPLLLDCVALDLSISHLWP